ncbi:MAG TPA: amidohydrolase family protein [Longimicrobiaceae bacterium]|nr:amidohydrolase family protein [Longimicrobiaceae bacterium]
MPRLLEKIRFATPTAVLLLSGLTAVSACAQPGFGSNAVQIGPGEECPAGTTEIRPSLCMAPDFPPPSIVDYRPRSTLVTEETLVPSARFPVVDIHGHARNLVAPGTIEEMVKSLDELNVRVYVAADSYTGERLRDVLHAIAASPYRERFRVMAGIDFRDMSPGWGARVAREVEEAIRGGAIGIGEVSKSFGLTITKPDGSRLRVDDPDLDPLWETLGRLGAPAFIHTAEPQEFFQPLDFNNERWLELALFSDRRNYMPGNPTFEQLMTERDNLFRRHPHTTFIAAHFGWHANDLPRLARLLDEFPNVHVETGAVLYDIGRQPRAARKFFIEYQDRILFGKDAFQPSEYPPHWRVFETDDDYFDYYRDYHAFWKLYGMDLPDEVLRKVYYENALRLFPGIPTEGFPR